VHMTSNQFVKATPMPLFEIIKIVPISPI
jgi:hypothetical protein